MKRSAIETILGAAVIAIGAIFLVFSYKVANVGAGAGGYEIVANFSGIGGLNKGDEVQISGVKIGTVSRLELDSDTYLAKVYLLVDAAVKLPTDTAALISSESLLGGRYVSLEPGADEEMIQPGGAIQYTQAPQNLEQLLGQFIFSMNGAGEEKRKAQQAANDPAL